MEEIEQWEVLGSLDELNCFLGLAKSLACDKKTIDILTRVQIQIYKILCEVANKNSSLKIVFSDIYFILRLRESWEGELEDVRDFVLPGGNQFSSTLHCARAVARRAERECVKYKVGEIIIDYLDKLACLLFDLSVFADKEKGTLTLISNFKK